MRPALLALSLGLASALSAQGFREGFDAGFSPSLGWAGDLAAFSGEAGRLVLRDARPSPSTEARAWAPALTRRAACWSLDLAQDFSASPSNRLRWWLAADRPLSGDQVAGFYLDFGGVSGSGDALELFYESGQGTTLVLTGAVGFAAVDPLRIVTEVCASEEGTWRLSVRDTSGLVVDSARGASPVPLAGAYVGLEVRFTATRNGLLSLDDLSIDPLAVDTSAPRLVLAQALDPRTVRLLASEPLAEPSAAAGNYRLARAPVEGARLSRDTVWLSLGSDLPEGTPVGLEIAGWTDLTGNLAAPITTRLTYVAPRRAERYDLLVSEVMADPTPSIGLPEVEYVELYNASRRSLPLGRFVLARGTQEVALPDTVLPAGAYLALAGQATGDARFYPFPSLFALPNAGATLRLQDGGAPVDEVTYEDGFHDGGKRDGGYSLARRDLSRPCLLGRSGWTSSRALAGGTPGVANAVAEGGDADGREVDPLRITSVALLPPDTLVVETNRALTQLAPAPFRLGDQAVGPIVEERPGRYRLITPLAFAPGRLAGLTLATSARSCVPGEIVSADTVLVGLPERPSPGDWALSEIMYDPLPGQGRWVELYNRSEKLLSLTGLLLAEATDEGTVREAFGLSRGGLVAPGQYVVVAADAEALRTLHPGADERQVLAAEVPTLGDEGCLLLADAVAEERYFLVCYRERWHNRAYAKTEGVSLERIDLEGPAGAGANWTSAASTAGFATPTRPNSQARLDRPDGATRLALSRERFSPDGDGFEDLLTVDYAFDAPGTLVTFEVVDLQGRSLYRPPEEEAVGRRGSWTWDGVTDEGRVVDRGTYVLRAAYWSEDAVGERVYLPFSVVGF